MSVPSRPLLPLTPTLQAASPEAAAALLDLPRLFDLLSSANRGKAIRHLPEEAGQKIWTYALTADLLARRIDYGWRPQGLRPDFTRLSVHSYTADGDPRNMPVLCVMRDWQSGRYSLACSTQTAALHTLHAALLQTTRP